MTVALAKKVPFRAEHTGVAASDRAQRMAQQVGAAHEQTKLYASILGNRAFASLATDVTIGATTYATLLSTTLTTLAPTGYLLLTATASGVKITNAGTVYFQLVVDGVVAKGVYTAVPVTFQFSTAIVWRVAVAAGPHTIALQWKTNTASAQIHGATVNEEHAALLVQESAT